MMQMYFSCLSKLPKDEGLKINSSKYGRPGDDQAFIRHLIEVGGNASCVLGAEA